MTWYRRAPTTPQTTTNTAPSRMSDGLPPFWPQRIIVTQTATTTPTARSSPYTWRSRGPSSRVPSDGLGIDARARDIAEIVGGALQISVSRCRNQHMAGKRFALGALALLVAVAAACGE